MRGRRHGPIYFKFVFLTLIAASSDVAIALTQPLNGCTFYKPRLKAYFSGCAEFSAVRGRHGCHKVKGVCPSCVTYPGDNLQMWLPDYLIEITRHFGQSKFANASDGKLLAAHLATGVLTWQSGTLVPVSQASKGDQSASSGDSFWHARILTVPYGPQATTFPPLPQSFGTGVPACFSALSEFIPSQWNYNAADAPYALAWAPVGATRCLTIAGGGVAAGLAAAKQEVSKVAVAAPMMSFSVNTCALPVQAQEAVVKNALPSADTISPLGDLSKLCMGSWGPLVPRTGWILSNDPFLSAMAAAYKFQSLSGDMHLNQALKLRDDDKWQIIYPPRLAGSCFKPGLPTVGATHGGDFLQARVQDEMTAKSPGRGHTYVIAVWRRRNTCEEPLETVGGWTANHHLQFTKNMGLCQAVYSE